MYSYQFTLDPSQLHGLLTSAGWLKWRLSLKSHGEIVHDRL